MRFVRRLLRFWTAGLPAFVAALGVNFLLVEKLFWPKPLAYVVVLWLQMSINFFACRILVFEPTGHEPVLQQYTHFLSGIGIIRLVEWLFYTILVEAFHVYYLAVQLMSVVLFALAKFKFAESLFERRRTPLPELPSDAAEHDPSRSCEYK
jgi:putative flippase GtrA